MSLVITPNYPLDQLNTFRIKSVAEFFCAPTTEAELLEALRFAQAKKISIFILGGGSNVLLTKAITAGLTIQNCLKGIEFGSDGEVSVMAGEGWDAFVEQTVARGLSGLENLSLIPGAVGASPIQNIGAYGFEVSQTIKAVEAINMETLEKKVFSNRDCQFSYRHSFFKTLEGKKYLITKVIFALRMDGRVDITYKDLAVYFAGQKNPSLSEVRQAIIDIRKTKLPDPKEWGTVGSFYKNPIVDRSLYEDLKTRYPDLPAYDLADGRVKIPLAYILDVICNLKGYSEGQLSLYKNQPLCLVTNGAVEPEKVIQFSQKISNIVKEKTGIEIEMEVVRV